jgi:hypothetical protein
VPPAATTEPAPRPEVAEEFSDAFTSSAEQESILTGAEGAREALFDDDFSAPRVEMPSTLVSPPSGEAPDQPPIPSESSVGSEAGGTSHDSSITEKFSSREFLANQPETLPTPASEDDGSRDLDAGLATEIPVLAPGAELSREVARRAKAESMLAAYFLIFLIPYAIFITIVAGYFYWRIMQTPHPLEMLNDFGDNPPAKRGSSSVIDIIPPETTLPGKLQVALGQRIRLGDLEVMPTKVEQRKIVYVSENKSLQPQESQDDALVLTLELRNVSDDVYFIPTDPFFERQWREDSGATKPYTFLEMGARRFFGGPIRRNQRGKAATSRELIQGQENDNQILRPHEARTTVIATDPDNREILKTLDQYHGPLVWRIQLRRGLVALRDREVSATAVIGVVFDDRDIIRQSRSHE